MIYIPCFNVLTLPDVSCYFRLDYLNGMSDQPVKAGDKVLFLMLEEQREGGEIEAEDIYPIAVRGVVESIENQWALVHTTNRVNLDSIQVEGKSFRLEMRMRPDLNDLDPDEKEERFQKMRSAMLQTFQGTQWMQGGRSAGAEKPSGCFVPGSGSPDCKRQLRSGIGGAEGFAGYSGNVSHPARPYPGDEKSRNCDRPGLDSGRRGNSVYRNPLYQRQRKNHR